MLIYIAAAVIIFILIKELLRIPTIGKYEQRYVFITGCDTGFGNELARKLDSLGFNVFAGCFTEKGDDELRKVTSMRLKTVSLDVTKIESIERALKEIEKHLPSDKGLWALVNNAGTAANIAPSEFLKGDDYDRCLAVNLFGVIDVSRVFQPLVRKGQGRIVNISSVMGRIAPAGAPYSVSKYGVEAFTDVLRREVLRQGVTVHLISPGFFATSINTNVDFHQLYKRSFSESSKDVQQYYGSKYVDAEMSRLSALVSKFTSAKTHQVVDAYTHAITAMFPRDRYLVGDDCKYYFRVLWNLPEFLADRILTWDFTIPEGEKNTISR